jgi:glucosylceramidase
MIRAAARARFVNVASSMRLLGLFVLITAACHGEAPPNGQGLVDAAGSADGDGGSDTPLVAHAWQTDSSQNLAPQPDIAFAADAPSALPTIDVDDTRTFQTIDGFGAAITDTSAWLIYTKMTSEQRTELMTKLFDPMNGIGISFTRVPMAASDFHVLGQNDTPYCPGGGKPYSYDDNPPGGSDPNMTHFSIAHDLPYIIPVLKQALALNPELEILANPWSPPAWMKTNGYMTNCGNGGHFKSQYNAALARYFVKFIQAYQQAGVPIHAITPQNEPGQQTNYPGMNWTSAEEATFIRGSLGPQLAAAGLHPKILAFDYNASGASFATDLLEDAGAAQYTDGVAFHCYGGVDAGATAGALHDRYPNKIFYGTECTSSTTSVKDATDVIIDMTRGWARGALMWNIALDPSGGPKTGTGCGNCTATVTIDPANGSVRYERQYYELAHASKFVPPGSMRIDSSALVASNGKPENVAFIAPDGTKVLLVHNRDAAALTFRVRWNLSRSFVYTLPANGIVTFTWTGSAPPVTGPLAINAGGTAAPPFDLDSHRSGGAVFNTTAAIDTSAVTMPAPQAVYQTERYGALTYDIHPLAPGAAVTVRLHFAEAFFTQPGQRLFGVTINGMPALQEYDIVAKAGGAHKAVVDELPATVDASGTLTIQLTPGSQNNPKINGIEIVPR